MNTIINKIISKIGDKPLHTICCALITLIFGQINIILGIIIALIAGFSKELYDKYKGTTGFSWDDIGYDILGIIIGTVLLLIF